MGSAAELNDLLGRREVRRAHCQISEAKFIQDGDNFRRVLYRRPDEDTQIAGEPRPRVKGKAVCADD